ncbi:hypothetical protein HELRODRAFT_113572 [Helobdella robusta]|uniref:NADPH--cytochrome P450 reductase n=1 Tax=Helobdella robusta TaxID=6412 RepID=T1EFT9_HELRO|nr:hypothetical protein HELRODRAFT_113572 [Helobdella robusta]ESN99807.1 hypothetical protein HELRODRAFT_113572 [Helobdella robusta]
MSSDSLLSSFGVLDALLLAVIAGGCAYYFGFRKKTAPPVFKKLTVNPSQTSNEPKGFIERMKDGGRSIVIFFGSQTGTAEEFATRLMKESSRYGMKAILADPEDCDMETLCNLTDIDRSLAIFLMATYGEGDPTDNAQEFYDWLRDSDASLSGIRYAVFGLGNKTYEHYNAIGKFVDKKLEELGAERIFPLGLGDDDANIEEDFLSWKEKFWPAVCDYFGVSDAGEDVNVRQYSLTLHNDPEKVTLFKGEPGRIGSFQNQKPPFDAKNPFLSTIISTKELHKAGDRSCLHINIDLTGSRLRYDTGDHVGVLPRNDSTLVNWLGERLKVDLDAPFTLTSLDEEAMKKHPFPCPTTFRTALTFYLDITSCPRTNVLKELSEYTDDGGDKEFLLSMTKSSPESKEKYMNWVVKDHRTTLHLLEDIPSLHPPIDHLCELLPRLQVRYYSISSSPKVNPNLLSITAVVVEYTTPTSRHMRGVCTGLLSTLRPSEVIQPKIPVFIRRSQFRLPFKTNLPIIMIGPGTGLAPFMGFLQERKVIKSEGDKPLGEAYLYFGCRHEAEDFIYEEELKEYLKDGTLNKLYLAFSRDQEKKVYVQHLLEQNSEEVWNVLQQKGHLYICGDARNMATDVDKVLHKIVMACGNHDSASANDYIKRLRSTGKYSCDVWS